MENYSAVYALGGVVVGWLLYWLTVFVTSEIGYRIRERRYRNGKF